MKLWGFPQDHEGKPLFWYFEKAPIAIVAYFFSKLELASKPVAAAAYLILKWRKKSFVRNPSFIWWSREYDAFSLSIKISST